MTRIPPRIVNGKVVALGGIKRILGSMEFVSQRGWKYPRQ